MSMPIHDDDWMLDHYGHTGDELRDMMLAGDDIGGVFDGDPIELLG